MTIQVTGSCILFSDSSVQTTSAPAKFPTSATTKVCGCATFNPDLSVCNYYPIRLTQNLTIPCVCNLTSSDKLAFDIKSNGIYTVCLPSCFYPNVINMNYNCSSLIYQQANGTWYNTFSPAILACGGPNVTCSISICLGLQGDCVSPSYGNCTYICTGGLISTNYSPYWGCCYTYAPQSCNCGCAQLSAYYNCFASSNFGISAICGAGSPVCCGCTNLLPLRLDLAQTPLLQYNCPNVNALHYHACGNSHNIFCYCNNVFTIGFTNTVCYPGIYVAKLLNATLVGTYGGTAPCSFCNQLCSYSLGGHAVGRFCVACLSGFPCVDNWYGKVLTHSVSQDFFAVQMGWNSYSTCTGQSGPPVSSNICVYKLSCLMNCCQLYGLQNICLYSLAYGNPLLCCWGATDTDTFQNSIGQKYHDLDKCSSPFIYSYITGCGTVCCACICYSGNCCLFVMYKFWKGTSQLCYCCCSISLSLVCFTPYSSYACQSGGFLTAYTPNVCNISYATPECAQNRRLIASLDGQYTTITVNGTAPCCCPTCACVCIEIYTIRDCNYSSCTTFNMALIDCRHIVTCYPTGGTQGVIYTMADCCLCHIFFATNVKNQCANCDTCSASCQISGMISRNTAGTGYVISWPICCCIYGCNSRIAISCGESGGLAGICNETCCFYACGFSSSVNGLCGYGMCFNPSTCAWSISGTWPGGNVSPTYYTGADIRAVANINRVDCNGTPVNPLGLHQVTNACLYNI